MDMANFVIDVMRPTIIAKDVEYEKKKFAEFLNVQEGWYTFHWFLPLTLTSVRTAAVRLMPKMRRLFVL
jgi:phage-related protein